MSDQQAQRPAAARVAATQLVWRAAAHGARAAVAAKGGVVAAALAAVVLAVLALALGCAVVGAAFQSSTAVWPVPVTTHAAGGYRAAGWHITSRFGWRDNPFAPGTAEFHDGVDLAGPALCRRCPAASMFDGQVTYVGWDSPGDARPDAAAGGQTVRIESGGGAYEVLYAHLEPYRLYVQLQGRIADRHGRYDAYDAYQPVGQGELAPDGEIAIACDGDLPDFVPTRIGPGTLMFTYDRPATCRTTVRWGERGGGWEGWTPDGPVALAWSTPVDVGRAAGDVALRFRAHLVPPPPPPTATPVVSGTTGLGDEPGRVTSAESGEARPVPDAARLAWRIADIPPAPQAMWSASTRIGAAGGLPQAREEATPVLVPTVGAGEEEPATPAAPQLALVLTSSRTEPAIGQVVSLAASVFSDGAVAQVVAVRASLPAALEVLEVSLGGGSCAANDREITCSAQAGVGRPATLRITARVSAGTPPHTRLTVRASAEAGGSSAADDVTLQVAALVIDEPWPPPTALPTPTPAPGAPTGSPGPVAPTALPAEPITAPCYRAVAAALSRQGARYSQGGALADDPRGADGLPLPRTGPASFDCSGLVWWAYAQAGVPVGHTTYQQLDDGVGLACTLDDLRGVFTRCWAPGDLVFLRYPAGQHVAIYAGSGLFMDCFNHRVGCVLHDVSRDPFYRAHFLQARRIVGGCEDMALDPGAPVPPPLDGEPQGDVADMCVVEPPTFARRVETLDGCGPPVRLGEPVYQLDSVVGFVGLTGATTGPHLHIGLRARSYDGSYTATNICTPGWLNGRLPPPDANCWTELADPLDFLPRAHGGELLVGGTPIPADAPYQLPPPGQPGSLVLTPEPGAAPVGQYWSPFADGGRYGGGSAVEWLRGVSCAAWKELPWCR